MRLFRTAWAFCALAALAGALAPWWPALELFNHFRPFIAGAAAALFATSFLSQSRALQVLAGVLVCFNVALLLLPHVLFSSMLSSAANAPQDDTLRVMTLNTWTQKVNPNLIADLISKTEPDAVLLQEVQAAEQQLLFERLRPVYKHILFDPLADSGPALLSKKSWVAAGTIDSGRPRPIGVWARFLRQGEAYELASVHIANPFEWADQPGDVDRLIAFVHARTADLIIGGDLNLTPFSWGLTRLCHATGLRWGQTFSATWPARRWLPIVLLDHVLVSPALSVSHISTGPAVGSDHRPVIAEVAWRLSAKAVTHRTELGGAAKTRIAMTR